MALSQATQYIRNEMSLMIRSSYGTGNNVKLTDRVINDITGVNDLASKMLASQNPEVVILQVLGGPKGNIIMKFFSKELHDTRISLIQLLEDTASMCVHADKDSKTVYKFLKELYKKSVKKYAKLIGYSKGDSNPYGNRYQNLKYFAGMTDYIYDDDDEDDDDEFGVNLYEALYGSNRDALYLDEVPSLEDDKMSNLRKIRRLESTLGRTLSASEIDELLGEEDAIESSTNSSGVYTADEVEDMVNKAVLRALTTERIPEETSKKKAKDEGPKTIEEFLEKVEKSKKKEKKKNSESESEDDESSDSDDEVPTVNHDAELPELIDYHNDGKKEVMVKEADEEVVETPEIVIGETPTRVDSRMDKEFIRVNNQYNSSKILNAGDLVATEATEEAIPPEDEPEEEEVLPVSDAVSEVKGIVEGIVSDLTGALEGAISKKPTIEEAITESTTEEISEPEVVHQTDIEVDIPDEVPTEETADEEEAENQYDTDMLVGDCPETYDSNLISQVAKMYQKNKQRLGASLEGCRIKISEPLIDGKEQLVAIYFTASKRKNKFLDLNVVISETENLITNELINTWNNRIEAVKKVVASELGIFDAMEKHVSLVYEEDVASGIGMADPAVANTLSEYASGAEAALALTLNKDILQINDEEFQEKLKAIKNLPILDISRIVTDIDDKTLIHPDTELRTPETDFLMEALGIREDNLLIEGSLSYLYWMDTFSIIEIDRMHLSYRDILSLKFENECEHPENIDELSEALAIRVSEVASNELQNAIDKVKELLGQDVMVAIAPIKHIDPITHEGDDEGYDMYDIAIEYQITDAPEPEIRKQNDNYVSFSYTTCQNIKFRLMKDFSNAEIFASLVVDDEAEPDTPSKSSEEAESEIPKETPEDDLGDVIEEIFSDEPDDDTTDFEVDEDEEDDDAEDSDPEPKNLTTSEAELPPEREHFPGVFGV